MNKKQKRILWIGITIITLMGLFPPHYSNGTAGMLLRWNGAAGTRRPGWMDSSGLSYDLLFFTNPSELALAHLTIQWIIVSILTAGAIYSTKEPRGKTTTIPEKNNKPQAAKEDDRFSKIAEQIAERHNKYGVTLTNPETGEDLLAGMTDEQRENYRQFKIKTSRIRQEEKENK